MSLPKPYFRIYRPFKSNSNSNDKMEYIIDADYCSERLDLVRYYSILENELLDIFKYIEPDNLSTYSIKNYQLLTNICIEVENNLSSIINANQYTSNNDLTMTDYRKLDRHMRLSEYEIKMNVYKYSIDFKPFYYNSKSFSEKKPDWYTAYNSVKHERTKNIHQATLKNVIHSLGGLYVILYAQFAAYSSNGSDCLITWKNLYMGQFNKQNFIPIFEIIKEPLWQEDEKYDFDWDLLKLLSTSDRFQKLNI